MLQRLLDTTLWLVLRDLDVLTFQNGALGVPKKQSQ